MSNELICYGTDTHERTLKWHRRFMKLAATVAEWSKDPSTRVGTVIVDRESKRVLSLGYNGFPRGMNDSAERYADRDIKLALVVHGEANALVQAHMSVSGAVLYTTKFPCSACAKLIAQAGIDEVVVFTQDPTDASVSRWAADAEWSRMIFRESGVVLTELTPLLA